MSISMSGINKMSTVSYGNTSVPTEPNWDLVPYKGMKVPSNEELVNQIKELAQKEANATTGDEFEKLAYQREKLRAQFISSVSPDRKMLCKEAAKAIQNQKSKEATQLGEQTLLSYLNKQDENKSTQTMQDGGSIKAIFNSTGGYDYEVSSGGDTVLSSAKGKWYCTKTPAELEKSVEFNKIYDGAYDAQKKSKNKELSPENSLYSEESSFDARA
jgi:hypothetical protein